VDGRGETGYCPFCDRGLDFHGHVAVPDYYLRITGEQWEATTRGPGEGEVGASPGLGFMCPSCVKTFRLVYPA
jgi:hypothetical protein